MACQDQATQTRRRQNLHLSSNQTRSPSFVRPLQATSYHLFRRQVRLRSHSCWHWSMFQAPSNCRSCSDSNSCLKQRHSAFMSKFGHLYLRGSLNWSTGISTGSSYFQLRSRWMLAWRTPQRPTTKTIEILNTGHLRFRELKGMKDHIQQLIPRLSVGCHHFWVLLLSSLRTCREDGSSCSALLSRPCRCCRRRGPGLVGINHDARASSQLSRTSSFGALFETPSWCSGLCLLEIPLYILLPSLYSFQLTWRTA